MELLTISQHYFGLTVTTVWYPGRERNSGIHTLTLASLFENLPGIDIDDFLQSTFIVEIFLFLHPKALREIL